MIDDKVKWFLASYYNAFWLSRILLIESMIISENSSKQSFKKFKHELIELFASWITIGKEMSKILWPLCNIKFCCATPQVRTILWMGSENLFDIIRPDNSFLIELWYAAQFNKRMFIVLLILNCSTIRWCESPGSISQTLKNKTTTKQTTTLCCIIYQRWPVFIHNPSDNREFATLTFWHHSTANVQH